MSPEAKRILIVEDQLATRNLLRDILETTGYKVLEADNGQAAVAAALKHVPDLILMDIMMPLMSGIEATAQMRAVPKLKGVPIVLLTAKGTVGDVEQGLAAGANDYVVKPFEITQLLAKVARQLGAPSA